MESSGSDPCLTHNLKGHKKRIIALQYMPDNKNIVTGSEDCTLMMWNSVDKDVRCYNYAGHSDVVTDIDCAENGKLLASSSADRTIRLWVPTVRGGSAEMKAHTSAVKTVAFSPDIRQLCSGSNDKSIKLWDIHRRKFMISFTGHNHWVNNVKYTQDGKCIVSCSEDKTIRLWDIASKECINVISFPRIAKKLAVNPNKNSVAAAMSSGSVRIYDMVASKLQQHYVLHDSVTSVAWHPSGNYLLTSGLDGTMKILDVIEGRPLYTLQGSGGPILAVAFSPDGEHFACAGEDRNVMIWKTNFISDDLSTPSGSMCSSTSVV